MDRLLKAGKFLSSQQKQSRYYMCLTEGPSSATHDAPVGIAGKVYRALPQAMEDQSQPGSRSFCCHLKNCDYFPTLQAIPIILCANRI